MLIQCQKFHKKLNNSAQRPQTLLIATYMMQNSSLHRLRPKQWHKIVFWRVPTRCPLFRDRISVPDIKRNGAQPWVQWVEWDQTIDLLPRPLPGHASQTEAGISRRVWALIKRCGGVAPRQMQYDIRSLCCVARLTLPLYIVNNKQWHTRRSEQMPPYWAIAIY